MTKPIVATKDCQKETCMGAKHYRAQPDSAKQDSSQKADYSRVLSKELDERTTSDVVP